MGPDDWAMLLLGIDSNEAEEHFEMLAQPLKFSNENMYCESSKYIKMPSVWMVTATKCHRRSITDGRSGWSGCDWDLLNPSSEVTWVPAVNLETYAFIILSLFVVKENAAFVLDEQLKLAEKKRRSCNVLVWKSQNVKVRLGEVITESKFTAETESKLSNSMTDSITFNVVDAADILGKALDT